MLRILRHDEVDNRVVLILQGRIVAEWADLLESECLELSRSGLRVWLDLAGVTFIGRPGVDVLGRLVRSGIEIVGCSALIADMLEQEGIEAARDIEDTNDRPVPWKRGGETDA